MPASGLCRNQQSEEDSQISTCNRCNLGCHAMPCYAMLCHAMPCSVMLCCAMPCHAVLCHAVLCYAMPCCAMPCHAVLCHAVLCCTVLCCGVLLWLQLLPRARASSCRWLAIGAATYRPSDGPWGQQWGAARKRGAQAWFSSKPYRIVWDLGSIWQLAVWIVWICSTQKTR